MAFKLPDVPETEFIKRLRRKGLPIGGEETVDAQIPAADFSFIATVMTLLVLCPLTLVGILIKDHNPGWHFGALPLFVSITYLAMMYRARKRIALGPMSDETARDKRIQLVLLIIAARLAPNLFDPGSFSNDIKDWIAQPYDIINPDFWLALVTLLAAWIHSRYLGRLISRLYVQQGEMYVNTRNDDRSTVDHVSAYRHLASHWREGTFVCLFLFLLVYLSTAKEANNPAGLALGLTCLYFMLGIPLLSWARLRLLRTGWQLNNVRAPGGLSSIWARAMLAAFGLATTIAIILPHTSTFDILSLINGPFLALVRGNPPVPPPIPNFPHPETTPPPATPSPSTTDTGGHFPFWEIVGGVLFWSITLGIVLYALSLLVNKESGGGKVLHFLLTPFRWLWQAARNLWRLLFGRRPESEIGEIVAESEIVADKGLAFQALHWLRRDPLPHEPRDKVRYYYGKMLRRGTKIGLPRAHGMTTGEYAAYLAAHVPETETVNDATALTAAFSEARYSSRPIPETTAVDAGTRWQRLAHRLRRQKG